MVSRLGMVGLGGALTACAFVLPALGATETPAHAARRAPAPSAGFGTFTPAAADPRLAAAFARAGLDDDAFRFTPAETRRANRAVTVAVRSRLVRSSGSVDRPAGTPATVGLAPIAYNLGVGVGWKRFAVAGDVSHVDLAGPAGSRESASVGVAYRLDRVTARIGGQADRPLSTASRLLEQPPSYTVDVGGSFALTRHVDLTAGVRYKTEREQRLQLDDTRRDSQAVYVGTAFRF